MNLAIPVTDRFISNRDIQLTFQPYDIGKLLWDRNLSIRKAAARYVYEETFKETEGEPIRLERFPKVVEVNFDAERDALFIARDELNQLYSVYEECAPSGSSMMESVRYEIDLLSDSLHSLHVSPSMSLFVLLSF